MEKSSTIKQRFSALIENQMSNNNDAPGWRMPSNVECIWWRAPAIRPHHRRCFPSAFQFSIFSYSPNSPFTASRYTISSFEIHWSWYGIPCFFFVFRMFETFNKVLMKSNFEIKLSLNIQLFLIFYYHYYYCSTCSLPSLFGLVRKSGEMLCLAYNMLNACTHFIWWENA